MIAVVLLKIYIVPVKYLVQIIGFLSFFLLLAIVFFLSFQPIEVTKYILYTIFGPLVLFLILSNLSAYFRNMYDDIQQYIGRSRLLYSYFKGLGIAFLVTIIFVFGAMIWAAIK